jgi:hypothetical protein
MARVPNSQVRRRQDPLRERYRTAGTERSGRSRAHEASTLAASEYTACVTESIHGESS